MQALTVAQRALMVRLVSGTEKLHVYCIALLIC